VVADISHEGLSALLREEDVSFQCLKTFKESNDPDFEAKQARVLELYAIADGHAGPGPDDPQVVICLDEFGPLTLQPHPGRQWTRRADCHGLRRRRRRATYTRPHGVRHLLAAYDLSRDRLYGHIKTRKGRTEFLAFCRYIRSLYPPDVRLAFVLDNFSPHLTTKTDSRVGEGRRKQRRAGLRPVLRQLAEPHRGAVHRPALLRELTAPTTPTTAPKAA
jgi:hypothetical protein